MSQITHQDLLGRFPAYRHMSVLHPGIAPVVNAFDERADRMGAALEHHQASLVTTRDSQPLDGYQPKEKVRETFRPSFKINSNAIRWELDQRYPFTNLHVHSSEVDALHHVEEQDIREHQYLDAHPEVSRAIDLDHPLSLEIRDPQLPDDKAVTQELARNADNRSGVLHPTREELEKEPELALWMTTNRADIDDAVGEVGKEVTRNTELDTWNLVSDKIADKAMEWFHWNSPMSREFFKDHPDAALYLHEHPALLNDIDRHNDRARNFMAGFNRISERLKPELIGRAAARAASPAQFNERFFQTHTELAMLSESARTLLPDFNFADQLTGQALDNAYSDRQMANDSENQWSQARVGTASVSSDYAKANSWFSRMVNRVDHFRNSVNELKGSHVDRLSPEDALLNWASHIEVNNSTLTHVNLAV